MLSRASVAVGHGGFGTTQAALEAAVPQAVLPLFSFDQFANADRVAAVFCENLGRWRRGEPLLNRVSGDVAAAPRP